MGAAKQQKLEKKGGRIGKRTSNGAETADWMSASPALIQHLIAAMAFTGGAVRFGYTRDGGAYALGIYGDGDPYTLYCKPSEDVDLFLKECIADVAQAFADR